MKGEGVDIVGVAAAVPSPGETNKLSVSLVQNELIHFYRRAKAKNRAKAQRKNLPNKPTDFQVRVNIHEGRKLAGSGINPATKVLCGGEVKETSVQKGTNDPDFNDVIFFNFRCIPDEMFDKLLEFKVVNSKKLLKDSLIGGFKLDLGIVYDEPGHAFIRKWLLLTDPEDAAGGAKVGFSLDGENRCSIILLQ